MKTAASALALPLLARGVAVPGDGSCQGVSGSVKISGMSALPKRYFTPEEYLALEEKAEYKSQYVAGEIFAMAGAEPEHAEIVGNIVGELRAAFRGEGCKTYATDVRVRITIGELWTYPDVTVVCHTPDFDTSSRPKSLLNPQVIFEVLSPSTEGFDRGDKFARYRRLESLTDYVLVASDAMHVEHYVRQEGGPWVLSDYYHPTDCIPLRSVGCELALNEIYLGVDFPEGRS